MQNIELTNLNFDLQFPTHYLYLFNVKYFIGLIGKNFKLILW
jgi:hypothetical protein